MLKLNAAFAVLMAACTPVAAATAQAVVAPLAPPASHPGAIVVEQDTLIRLMVLNEVSSRTAAPGHRFVLRVDEPVTAGGATIIPVGAKAWGEILSAEKSGSVGKAGKLSARLLHVEVGGDAIPINGETKSAGDKGTTQVAAGMLGLGPFALLAPGNNAKLKAGEIFSAYFTSDYLYDPTTGKLTPLLAAEPIPVAQ